MSKTRLHLCTTALAAALAAASFTAHAETPIKAFFTFDNVVSGSPANDALGSWASRLSFVNPDTAPDYDINGVESGFHWVPISGDVTVLSDIDNALSLDNVLSNGGQPILVTFINKPVNITRFSIAQDLSGYGNPQANGSRLAFLDAYGHEIAGTSVSYTQGGNLGLTIQNLDPVYNVSAVLLAGGRNYDNMYVNAVAVPEPEGWAMLSGGLLLMGAMIRRRRG